MAKASESFELISVVSCGFTLPVSDVSVVCVCAYILFSNKLLIATEFSPPACVCLK